MSPTPRSVQRLHEPALWLGHLFGQGQRPPLASGGKAESLSRTPPACPPRQNVKERTQTHRPPWLRLRPRGSPLNRCLQQKLLHQPLGRKATCPLLKHRVLRPCHLPQLPAIGQDSGAGAPGCPVSAAAAGRGLQAAPGPDGRLAGCVQGSCAPTTATASCHPCTRDRTRPKRGSGSWGAASCRVPSRGCLGWPLLGLKEDLTPGRLKTFRPEKCRGLSPPSPPPSEVSPPLAIPTQHNPSLLLAASPAAAAIPVHAPQPLSGPQGALCPTSQAGQARTLCPPQGLTPRLAGEVGATEQPGLGWWHPWTSRTDASAPLSLKRHNCTHTLCHANFLAARIQWGVGGAEATLTRGALWRRLRPQRRLWVWGDLSGGDQEGPLPVGNAGTETGLGRSREGLSGEKSVEPEDWP